MIKNILFYIKNFLFRYHETPKEIRPFTCFMCRRDFVFPFTSQDYMACNDCWKELGED